MHLEKKLFSLVRRVGARFARVGLGGVQMGLTADPRAIILPTMSIRSTHGAGRVRIGAESMVGASFAFESDRGEVTIGERCFINGGSQFISRSSITLGNDVTVAWGCYFYDHNSHSLDWRERAKDVERQNAAHRRGENFIIDKDWSTVKSQPIVIGDKAWIGFESVILGGVTVGEGAIVGARSVVRKSVPPWTIVGGNPAVEIGRVDADRKRGDR